MLLRACGGFSGASRPFYGFASGGLQGPPGASRGLQGAPGVCGGPKKPANMALNEKCARRVPPKPQTWARLKFHAGWSGWTRPPTMAGGGGGGGSASLRRAREI